MTNSNDPKSQFAIDSSKVLEYIKLGNKIYATQSGVPAFAKSMLYYDSAWQIAATTNDTFLLGVSLFAKGRAYDAWNNEPLKTIEYFEQAAYLYKALPQKYFHFMYINELIAHAYEKNNDSTNAIRTLEFIYNQLIDKPDRLKREMNFIPQMATVSSTVRNYVFAEKVLKNLYRREWIINDSESYNYLDYYYLTMARIEVYQYQKKHSPYIDSFEQVFLQSKNLSDSNYYSSQLKELYTEVGNLAKKAIYTASFERINRKYNNPNDIIQFQKSLNTIEKSSIFKQIEKEKERLQTQRAFLWILIALLIIISSMGVFLFRRNKDIANSRKELKLANDELSKKNLQNELLNKELHHRVKNNLQMILSLIYMQERNIKTEEAKKNLQEIRMRIESIAGLHRQLIEQTDENVNLKKYVTQMLNSVISLVGVGGNVISHLEIEDVPMPVSISFPLGLIFNEWFTNSIKYASKNNDALEINLKIKVKDGYTEIKYFDSGSLIKKEDVKPGLGLNIISLLCTQINAELHREPLNYFDYTLIIPNGTDRK